MLIPFGEKDGELVRVSMVERGLKCACICPLCKVSLVARKGSRKTHHFAHQAGSSCDGETLLHYLGKNLMRDRLVRALSTHRSLPMEWKCSECPDWHEGNLIRVARSVEVEYSFEVCRPDLTLFDKDGKPVVFIEIVVSHRPEPNVYAYAEKRSIRIVQIELSSSDDLEQLASDGPIRPASVTACTRTKCEKCSSPLSMQYLHVVLTSCWKCSDEMKIALIDQERALVGPREFSPDQVRIATERGALLKEKYSRTMGERYLANTCPNCDFMTGDFYLHHHYDREQRETGVPAGAICWSCRQREVRAKRSTVSVEVDGVWVDLDLRPTRKVDDIGSEE